MKQRIRQILPFLLLALIMLAGVAPAMTTEAEAAEAWYDDWLWPVPDNTSIFSPYVTRDAPKSVWNNRGGNHTGIDISKNASLSIVAAKTGTVKYVNKYGEQWKLPSYVVLEHQIGGKNYYSMYWHMKSGTPGKYDAAGKRLRDLKPGETIRQGEKIGVTGKTGNAGGVHLHFEIATKVEMPSNRNAYTKVGNTLNTNPKYGETFVRSNNSGYSQEEICWGGKINYKRYACDHKWGKVIDKNGTRYGICEKCGVKYDYLNSFTADGAGYYTVRKGERLCAEPYDGTQNVTPSGEIMVVGTVTNAYGHKWYKVSDGSYIYPQDTQYVRSLPYVNGKCTVQGGLNINRNPAPDSKVGVIPCNGQVRVYPDRTASNGWLYVDYKGTKGYVSGNCIAVDDHDGGSGLVIDTTTITMARGKAPSLHQYISSAKELVYVNIKLDGRTYMALDRPGSRMYRLSAVRNSRYWGTLSEGSHTLLVSAMDIAGSAMTRSIPVQVTRTVQPKCEQPSISYSDNSNGKTVVITAPGCTINYTINGTDGSGTSPVIKELTETAVITARASKSGMQVSDTAHKEIRVTQLEAPTFSVTPDATGSVVVIHSTEEAQIRYSVDGVSYQDYLEPIHLEQNGTVSAYAARNGRKNSEIAQQTVEMKLPAAPAAKLSVKEAQLAQNETVLVSWNAISNASSYTVKAYLNDVELETRSELDQTSAAFILSQAGSYRFEVLASNAFGSSTASGTPAITAVAPLKVRFVDVTEDGEEILLSEQLVNYGAEATAPDPAPERAGHYFLRWDHDFSKVTSDMKVKPVYQIITYTVTFKDYRGAVLSEQSVPYGHAARIPDSSTLMGPNENYSFVGWSIVPESNKSKSSLTFVDSNMTAQASFTWTSQTKPVMITKLDATYDATVKNGFYTVRATLENTDRDYTRAILRVALKTTAEDGVQKVVDTASQAVNLRQGSTTEYEFTMNYGQEAATVEAVVVGYDYDGLTGAAYSEAKTATVQRVSGYSYGAYTEWSKDDPTGNPDWRFDGDTWTDSHGNQVEIEDKTVYRYRQKETTTSTNSSMSGWTLYDTTHPYGEWRDVGWVNYNPGSSDTTRVTDTRTVVDSYGYTEYVYYHYWGRNSQGTLYNSYGNGVWKNYEEIKSRSQLPKAGAPDGHQSYSKKVPGMHGMYWWYKQTNTISDKTHKEWFYQSRSTYPLYHFYRWTEWKEQETPLYGSDTMEVQTELMYRYRVRNQAETGPMDSRMEDTSGPHFIVTTDLKGRLPDGDTIEDLAQQGLFYVPDALPDTSQLDLTGRLATVMVYKGKNMDPNESQIQYVGQTTIGSGNQFEISFIPKSGAPTSDTGDYIVAMSVEGSASLFNVGRLPAPKPQYTVTYVNDLGETLKTQVVEEGGNSVAPVAPEKPGMNFVTWSETGTNVRSDMTITAIYTPKVYSVVFVDWINNEAYPYAVTYGTALDDLANEIGTREAVGYTFDGWAFEPGAVVEADQVISARYAPKQYTVRFYDGEQLLNEQSVSYGRSAVLPAAPEKASMTFLGWSTDTMWWNVTGDTSVAALYTYTETTMQPQSSTQMIIGEEMTEVTLTAEEGALIYYTLDGSAPAPSTMADGTETGATKLYTEPFLVPQGTAIRAIAVKPDMNASDVLNVEFDYDELPNSVESSFVEIGTYQVNVEPGKDITLKVNMGQNPGLIGYLFDIECDRSVFSLEQGEDGFLATPGEVSQTGVLICADRESKGWQVLWYDTAESTQSGNLFSVTLKVSDTAAAGTYPIKVSYSPENTITKDDTEVQNNDLDIEFGGSSLKIKGDINGDGRITTVDVVLVARYLINDFTFNRDQLRAADVTGDSDVTSADVVRLARYVLGLAELG